MPRGFHIKVLKDLDNVMTRISIDIKDLKDLKREHRDQEGSPTERIETRRALLPGTIARDRPSRYDEKNVSLGP